MGGKREMVPAGAVVKILAFICPRRITKGWLRIWCSHG